LSSPFSRPYSHLRGHLPGRQRAAKLTGLCPLGLLVDRESLLHLIGSETMTTWEWIVLIVIGALLFEFLVKREFVRLNERVWKLEKRVKQLEDRKD
jgi:hypothetical protein